MRALDLVPARSPCHDGSRRRVLCGAAGLALGWLMPGAAAAQDGRVTRPVAGDLLVKVGDASAAPLVPADIQSGPAPVLAWPLSPSDGVVRNGSRLNRVVLVRLDAAALVEKTRTRSADGVVAYSAICTHTGCEVGAFLPEEQALYCECHQSRFDPRDDAKVIDGPAPRNLPALPLTVVDGRLVVAGSFSTRPGFEQG